MSNGVGPMQFLRDENGNQVKYIRILDPEDKQEQYFWETTTNDAGSPVSDADVDGVNYIKHSRYYFKKQPPYGVSGASLLSEDIVIV